MTKDKRLRYMQTQVWEGETFDGMREVFSSLYAGDGAHTHGEAIGTLLKKGDDASDLLIDLLTDQTVLTDRYFADCLLPLGGHLGDWLDHADRIQTLIGDARLACEELELMVEGPCSRVAPDQRARDDLAFDVEVAQRLLAYDAVLAMVVGAEDAVRARLRDVAQAALANVAGLIEYISRHHVPYEHYLPWCHSAGGALAIAAEYVLEPLVIVAEAAKVTGHEALACLAVDEVARGLPRIEAGEHEDALHDVELELVALRSYLGCEGAEATGKGGMS